MNVYTSFLQGSLGGARQLFLPLVWVEGASRWSAELSVFQQPCQEKGAGNNALGESPTRLGGGFLTLIERPPWEKSV